ncbi:MULTISPECIES: apolipoprotein N-acyltransferase [Microbacterium]|uniref:Apolipoprotein N-acyltransferase n=2 Tax=Microbacterium TaxID=33882 RepID=A0ABU8LLD9_9MICO|nr:apolipoprotein N-acyltransferase [Microbacterium sp. STF-2]MEA1261662.1 apolipoprotein N-acyltransferase [Microbacterium sp. STF-2]
MMTTAALPRPKPPRASPTAHSSGLPDTPMLRLRTALPLAVVAGVLLDLSTPDVGWWPLAFIGVGLSLATLIGRSIGGALAVGLLFGASFYTLHLAWVGEFLGPVPRLALSGLETLLLGLGAIPLSFAYRWTRRLPPRGAIQLAVVSVMIGGLWTAREVAVGSWPYSGFPWARLGMTQVNGPFPEAASWIGVTGLSFLVAVTSAALVQWIRAGGLVFPQGSLFPVVIIGVLAVTPQFPTTSAGTFTVGWVQGNGPSGYFDDKSPGDILRAYSSATASLYGKQTDLVVWPEGAVDSDPLRDRDTATTLDQIATAAGSPLLVNAATTREEKTFNTSILWTPGADKPQLHDKVNPVPFGEYVPDRWLYEKIAPDLVRLIQREYTPGTNPPIITVGTTRVGLAICFDVIFDDVIRAGVEGGAELYVFQTNNADFRGSDENLQQLAFARMRAIETGRTVINVSTVGTSQVIDPTGTTIQSIGVDVAAADITEVQLRTGLTAGVILAPWLSVLIPVAALTLVAAAGVLDLRRRQPDRRPRPLKRRTTP